MQKIIPPTVCPSCGSKLTWKKDVLYCTYADCSSKVQKGIEHWAKTLKIKGLGPKTIEKLGLSSILDIYELDKDFLEVALGSEKLSLKLVDEINKSKASTLDMALPAFGIPLIGSSATQKLCSVLSHIDELTADKVKQAGLGPKATENLMKWYNSEYVPFIKQSLPLDLVAEKKPQVTKVKGTVCISGKLKSFKTKKLAEEALTLAGYKVKSSVTKDVTILINESGVESAKTTKARSAGIEVVTNLKQLLGEKHGTA